MAKLVVNKCPSCSAPLEVQPEATDVTCRYCGNSIHIERKRAPTQPETNRVHAHVMYIDPNAGARIARRVMLLGFLPVLIPLGITLGPMLAKKVGHSVRPLPATCGVNDDIEISGATFEGTGPLVVAETNCKVKISGSKLKGNVIVRAQGVNVKVEIAGSTLEAKDTVVELGGGSSSVRVAEKSVLSSEGSVVVAKTNGEVTFEDSTAKAKDAVVRGETNLKLECNACSLDGGDTGVAADNNLKLRLARGAVIKGGRLGIRSDTNPSIVMRESTIEGGTNAVEGGNNASIDAVGGTIKGGALALAFRSKPTQLSLAGTNVVGGQSFSSELSARPVVGIATASRAPQAAQPGAKASPAAAAPVPAAAPPFNGQLAASSLDTAAAQASATCKSTSGKAKKAFIDPGFVAEGSNANAKVRIEKDIAAGSPEVACVERIFRAIRIPAFDEKTRPSGMGRFIMLNP
jgi:hypothetical protein